MTSAFATLCLKLLFGKGASTRTGFFSDILNALFSVVQLVAVQISNKSAVAQSDRVRPRRNSMAPILHHLHAGIRSPTPPLHAPANKPPMATDKSGKENSEPEGTENASETDNKISGLPSDQRGDQDEETTATASASDSQSNGLADDEASGDEHSHVKLTQEEQNDEDGAALAEQRPLLSPKDAPAEPKLSILRCIFFFIATALTAMNLAYSQPLLDLFRKEFQIGVSEAGLIATVQSVGYMVGLINVSPLGDMMEKKKIVVVAVALLAPVDASLGLIGNYHAFLAANFAMGVLIGTVGSATTTFDVLPKFLRILFYSRFFPFQLSLMMSMGVEIAPPQHRGAVLGSMVSGNMFGTLGARLVSGAIADAFGYKWVYRLAAAEMVVLLIALYFGLPKTPVPARATDHDGEEGGKSGLGKFASAYWDVFTSMGTLLVKHPLLLKGVLEASNWRSIMSS